MFSFQDLRVFSSQ